MKKQAYNILMAANNHCSRKAHLSDELIEPFRNLIDSANTAFSNEIISPLTITLGDEFQGILIDHKSLF